MADPELVKTLDYILNRCGDAEIEAVAAAVVRRKRDLSLFGASGAADPARWAKQAAQELAGSAGSSLSSIRRTVRDMAAGMLRKEAPELTDDQIAELLDAWTPASPGASASGPEPFSGVVDADGGRPERPSRVPPDLLVGMVEQFVAYSRGTMPRSEDESLRRELGDWPERYWRSFPGGVRAVVGEFLKGGTSEGDFRRKLRAAVELGAS